jgi:PPOX class probable F420-dependent enzyme
MRPISLAEVGVAGGFRGGPAGGGGPTRATSGNFVYPTVIIGFGPKDVNRGHVGSLVALAATVHRMDGQTDKKRVPDELVDLVTTDRLGHISAVRADGSIATYIMWIDWDGEHVLTSSAVGSRKGAHWRRNPQTSVSVVAADDPWRFVIVRGRVTDIRPDEGLAFIDKMSRHYTGGPYRFRGAEREIFTITPDHVTASRGSRR